MVTMVVNDDGYREVIGAAEGFTESAEYWRNLLSWFKGRGLSGVRMITGDKASAMTSAVAEVFPDAAHIRRRARVVSTFPDGKSALMLVTTRLKYIAESEWG